MPTVKKDWGGRKVAAAINGSSGLQGRECPVPGIPLSGSCHTALQLYKMLLLWEEMKDTQDHSVISYNCICIYNCLKEFNYKQL